jgi:flagellar biosynthesis protein FlhF
VIEDPVPPAPTAAAAAAVAAPAPARRRAAEPVIQMTSSEPALPDLTAIGSVNGSTPTHAEAVEAANPMIAGAAQASAPTLARSTAPEQLPSHDLSDLLRRSGFSESFMAQLHGLPSWTRRYDRPLHATLADLGRELRTRLQSRPRRPLPARTAFIGTRGCGRTTALCKWLGVEVFVRGRRGRVIKLELDQPNPTESLNVYCEALGLGMEHYAPGLDLSTQQGDFLYADLPGISLTRPTENTPLAQFLTSSGIDGRVLVLNALHDLPTLRAAYSAGRDLGATHLVFTHCDELLQWGKLMDFLIDGNLTPLFLASGPSLYGDCEEDAVSCALRKTIPGA